MAEPALKIATEFVRIAVANFDMGWIPSVENDLDDIGLDLTDLHNALTCCEVGWSNKLEAEGVLLTVRGETTEGVWIEVDVWVNPDAGFYRIERVSPQ